VKRLGLIPSNVDLAGLAVELASAPDRLLKLRTALAAVPDGFDYVLMDSPPSLGLLTINAMVAADEVFIPLQTEFFALQGVGKLLKTVNLVQAKIRRCFGPEPKRTPLASRVTGVVERDAYRIEKVIFDSRPEFPVTANLYVPLRREFPVPGVVGTCGHSTNGKAAEAYQSFAQGLARLGYVCLIYDPIGQGERLQYLQEDLSSKVGGGVSEHLLAGNQQF